MELKVMKSHDKKENVFGGTYDNPEPLYGLR
mgnify:CR=1 FL=1